MKNVVFGTLLLLGLVSLLFTSCTKEYKYEEPPVLDTSVVYSFATDIFTMFESAGCGTGACHTASNATAGLDWSSAGGAYTSIFNVIDTTNAGSGKLFDYIDADHKGTAHLIDKYLVIAWINQGSKDN